jgi:hypothetical protein
MNVYDSPNLDKEIAKATRLISGLLQPGGGVRFSSFHELDSYITGQHGFTFIKARELGPKYFQLFYRWNNLWARVKDQPRMGRKSGGHMAVILAAGDSWEEEVGKFSRSGQLVPKQGFIRRLSDAGDFRSASRVATTAEQVYAIEDAWADVCHFDFPAGFDWSGVDVRFI